MRQGTPTDSISIAEASKRFGVSRRTIERWIRAGRLAAAPGQRDRRERLVHPDDVSALTAETHRSRPKGSAQGLDDGSPTPAGSPPPAEVAIVRGEPDYQDVIDQALQLVYSHQHRLISQLHPEAVQRLSLDQLRQGPLGHDLGRLAALARGEVREPKQRVLEAIESVLQLLFWPAAADDYSVPPSFWDTELGRMLALAKYRAFEASELVSIGNAARQLGVTRPTIYRWMDDRTLNYVRDDMSGRTFVVRRDIDILRRMAMETEGRQGRREEADSMPMPEGP